MSSFMFTLTKKALSKMSEADLDKIWYNITNVLSVPPKAGNRFEGDRYLGYKDTLRNILALEFSKWWLDDRDGPCPFCDVAIERRVKQQLEQLRQRSGPAATGVEAEEEPEE